jgi:hypothetical protein
MMMMMMIAIKSKDCIIIIIIVIILYKQDWDSYSNDCEVYCLLASYVLPQIPI